jgi:RNA polymerase sigma factor (sigma-70 family)
MTALKVSRPAEPPGTIESFDDFFRREHPRAAKLAWLLTRSASDADEIAQEAMVSVHGRFAELDSPAAYLTRVVVNQCRRWHVSGAIRLRLVQTLAVTAQTDTPAADEYLLDAIHTLPYRQRVVVIARYWGDWSEAEIAAALDCRPGTVKSLASRALVRLRSELES